MRRKRLLELLFFLERQAPFEDLDPGWWRGSCWVAVEDFQDVKLCTYNLLNVRDHVLNDRLCHPVVFEESVQVQASGHAETSIRTEQTEVLLWADGHHKRDLWLHGHRRLTGKGSNIVVVTSSGVAVLVSGSA